MAFRWLFGGFSMAFAMAFVWLFDGFRNGFRDGFSIGFDGFLDGFSIGFDFSMAFLRWLFAMAVRWFASAMAFCRDGC